LPFQQETTTTIQQIKVPFQLGYYNKRLDACQSKEVGAKKNNSINRNKCVNRIKNDAESSSLSFTKGAVFSFTLLRGAAAAAAVAAALPIKK
jgi:hypothetical protein